MSKELEEMQTALNKLDFYIWDNKETKNFEKQANKQIDVLQKGLDDLKSSLERKEKLENVWEIAKTHIALDFYLIKSCDTVFTYNNLTITNKLTETEFNLLKEILKE